MAGSRSLGSERTDTFPFLTDTLKFVFAGSELVEAGWDLGTFLVAGTSMTHILCHATPASVAIHVATPDKVARFLREEC
jgi:hypothetical protein